MRVNNKYTSRSRFRTCVFRHFASNCWSLKQFKACYVGFLQFVRCHQFVISAGVACIIPHLKSVPLPPLACSRYAASWETSGKYWAIGKIGRNKEASVIRISLEVECRPLSCDPARRAKRALRVRGRKTIISTENVHFLFPGRNYMRYNSFLFDACV